ncbi:MAG: hypothetical protein NQ127_03870 [Candidatus Cardinium sp.]|nr:hypothetical protein [Candidatus Cardinium sp.]
MANHFDVPVIIIEHKKLGASIGILTKIAQNSLHAEVVHFSCLKEPIVQDKISKLKRKQFLLAGAESHKELFLLYAYLNQ